MRILRQCLVLLGLLSILVGPVYAAVVTAIAALAFPGEAAGSLIERKGAVAGSSLLGRDFRGPGWFRGRPSATGSNPCDAAASCGSNLGPTNPALRTAVEERVAALRASDPANKSPIPVDLVTASGSGLDPDVSPEAALWQVPRVARERNLPEARVRALVESSVRERTLGFLGEPRVNVLLLNLALDDLR